MLFVTLSVLALLITSGVAFAAWDDMDSFLFAGLVWIIGGLVGGMLVIGLTALTFIPAERQTKASDDTTEVLQAIQMGDGVRGSFFLGSGVIAEENVYTYYRQNPNGSYQSGRIDADYAEVIESDTETPRIVTHHWYWSGWIMPRSVNDGMDFGGETYTIYVPKGSVKPLVDLSLPK